MNDIQKDTITFNFKWFPCCVYSTLDSIFKAQVACAPPLLKYIKHIATFCLVTFVLTRLKGIF